jgi:hypothetical protein
LPQKADHRVSRSIVSGVPVPDIGAIRNQSIAIAERRHGPEVELRGRQCSGLFLVAMLVNQITVEWRLPLLPAENTSSFERFSNRAGRSK